MLTRCAWWCRRFHQQWHSRRFAQIKTDYIYCMKCQRPRKKQGRMKEQLLTAGSLFEKSLKIAFWILTLLVAVIAYQGERVLRSVEDHEKRLTTIEARLYTAADAATDHKADREDMKEFIALNLTPISQSLAEIKETVKENREAIKQR